jgi:hypothetical protein
VSESCRTVWLLQPSRCPARTQGHCICDCLTENPWSQITMITPAAGPSTGIGMTHWSLVTTELTRLISSVTLRWTSSIVARRKGHGLCIFHSRCGAARVLLYRCHHPRSLLPRCVSIRCVCLASRSVGFDTPCNRLDVAVRSRTARGRGRRPGAISQPGWLCQDTRGNGVVTRHKPRASGRGTQRDEPTQELCDGLYLGAMIRDTIPCTASPVFTAIPDRTCHSQYASSSSPPPIVNHRT